jgi:succinoglycan biosynthesis transport protein ExoP
MPHDQRTSAFQDSSRQEHGWAKSGPGPLDWALGFLRRHYLVIASCAALSLAASIGVLKVVPPTYTADVKVLLGNSKVPTVQPQSMPDDAPAVDMESQIEILKSKTIATSVINQLNLADDPDMNGKGSPLHIAMNTARTMAGIPLPEAKTPSMDELVDEFQHRMAAFRIGTSAVIEVDFSASDPKRAAVIANAIVKDYFDDQQKAKTDEHRTITSWLHDRLQELGNDALTAERAVNELKNKGNIVSADGKFIDQQEVTDLTNRLVVARTHTASLMTRFGRFETMLASSNGAPDGGAAAVSDFSPAELGGNLNAPDGMSLNNSNSTQILNTLRQQYLDYGRRAYEFSAKYGEDHLAVVNLRATMKSIRQTIFDEVRRLGDIAKNDYEEAKQQQQEIEKQLARAIAQTRNTSAAELSIRELETSAKGYRALYESFLQRYMSSVQQGSFPLTEARVISPATAPQKKSKPKATLLLPLGLFGGVVLGAALGLLMELKDRGFRTTAQIEDRLRLPCLSVVPLLKRREVDKLTKKAAITEAEAGMRFGQRLVSRGSGTCWAATAMPSSRFAESIRSIRLAVDLDASSEASKVVGLTSTLPNEGKSTIAASLAQLIASAGKRVIVVDCDLRNPSLSATLAPLAGVGIADVVSGARSLEDTVWTDAVTKLDFLPGTGASPSDAIDILSNEQTKRLFDQLRETYDYVIVDLPPLAPVVDARAIATLLDSFVLIVEWGRTTADVIEHALNTAPNVYDSLLGVVLNKTDMKAMKRYANHYGDYYNHEHYIRYGQIAAE